jgi:hypothetical protein
MNAFSAFVTLCEILLVWCRGIIKYSYPCLSRQDNWQIYCILASCYIRLTLNICSFVRQWQWQMTNGKHFLSLHRGRMQQNLLGSRWRAEPLTETGEHLDSCNAVRIVVVKTDVMTPDNTVRISPKQPASPVTIPAITVHILAFSKNHLASCPSSTITCSCSETCLRNTTRVQNESYTVFLSLGPFLFSNTVHLHAFAHRYFTFTFYCFRFCATSIF